MEHALSALGSGWSSFLIVIAFLALVGTLVASTMDRVEERLYERNAEQLAALARGIRGAHLLWADGRRGDVKALAASPTLVDGLTRLDERPGDAEAKAIIRRRLEAHLSAFDFPSSAAMLTPDGDTVLLVGEGAEHARSFSVAFPEEFERVRRGLAELVIRQAEPNVRSAASHVEALAAAPIVDDDGATLGVVVWEFDPTPGLTEISSLGRLGRTSRAFVFDRDGDMLVDFGSATESPLEARPSERSALIARTLESYPETYIGEYPGPGGVRVIGASVWDEQLDLGIGVELSHEEAFHVYFELRDVIAGSLATMAALSLALLVILGTARARVVRGLQTSRTRLEQVVEERTSALANLNRELRIEAEQRMRHAWELETAREALEEANRKLEILASRDALTGLANRRAFEVALEREWQRATRSQTPIALLMVDVDDFKTLNDTQGHPAGDDALRRIGATLRAGSFARRPGDLISRFGGEEFALLLEDADADHAASIAEAIRAAILTEKIEHPASCVEGRDVVTVSVGATSLVPAPGEGSDLLVALADKALYRAKHAGRDRVALSTPGERTSAPRNPARNPGRGPEA